MPQSNKVSTLEAGALRRFVTLVRIGIQYVTFAARQTHRLTRLLYLAAEVIPSLKFDSRTKYQFLRLPNSCAVAHMLISDVCERKLAAFLDNANCIV